MSARSLKNFHRLDLPPLLWTCIERAITNKRESKKHMVGKFQVIDHLKKHWPASDKGPERTDYKLCLLDLGECPMRQMPQYLLDPDTNEIEKYGAGQLTGKIIKIEVREMNGRGNPTMRGRIAEVVTGNGEPKK